jgi:hypothetical protein
MRYYLDEDQSQVIAAIARERFGLDITASHELQMDHAIDSEQLQFATSEGRCIVTRNGPHFVALTRSFVDVGLEHAGVLIVPSSFAGNDFGDLARALAHHHRLYPDNIPNYVDYLHHAPDDNG